MFITWDRPQKVRVTVASDDGKHGVALEHLLQAVKVVLIKAGSTGIKKLVEATPANCAIKYSDLVGPPPALAGAMITFTREVVEMLKALPGCKIPFYKFIPRYHHHFGKQCRVADYGYIHQVSRFVGIDATCYPNYRRRIQDHF